MSDQTQRKSLVNCDYWPPEPQQPVTSCKHGPGDCEACGTTDRRDVKHTTRGGKGVVAALRVRR